MQTDSLRHQMYVISLILFIITLFSTEQVWAKWVLEQTDDGNWISMKTDAGHQLIVSQYEGETLFTVILEIRKQKVPRIPLEARLITDENESIHTHLKLLQKLPAAMAFRILLEEDEKQVFVTQMIAGLALEITFGKLKDVIHSLNFSLIGYTDAYTDLQIADEIGRLDLQWLAEEHKDKELNCYLKAKLFTLALRGRMEGKSSSQVKRELPEVENIDLRKVISMAYRVPSKEFPRHSSAKKYITYKRCMSEKSK